MNLTEIKAERKHIQKEVINEIYQVCPELKLNGSWLYGDFHFDVKTNKSLSDIDLFYPKIKHAEDLRIKMQLKSRLMKYGISKISIHPNTLLQSIPLITAREILLPEYLSQLLQNQLNDNNSDYRRNYLNAKFTLLFLRGTITERYSDIPSKYDNNLLLKELFDIKLGVSNKTFSSDQWRILKLQFPELSSFLSDKIIEIEDVEEILNEIRLENKEQFLVRNIQKKLYRLCS